MSIPLAGYTTLHIGGPAEYFVSVHSEKGLLGALAWADEHRQPVTVLGGGSNVLVSDAGIKGLVIKNEIDGVKYEGTDDGALVTAGAGVSWDVLVSETAARGLWGLENLSGIPGTVGGAVVQNINAYGVTIETMIESVTTVHVPTHESKIFSREECTFAYRDSFFKRHGPGKECIVTNVQLCLSRAAMVRTSYKSASQSIGRYLAEHDIAKPSPVDIRTAVLDVRKRIGMLEGMYRSAGSFFKNPVVSRDVFEHIQSTVSERFAGKGRELAPWHWPLEAGEEKVSAAFLMECTPFNKTAFVGKTFNDAVGISPVHTLSLVNIKNATSADVRTFVSRIIESVKKEFGVTLESEVCYLG